MGQLAAEFGITKDSGAQYLTADNLGSTRLVTKAAGSIDETYDYLPFGEEYSTVSPIYPRPPGGNGIKFTSKERDAETGLDYFGVRYMSSAQGRFTSPDTAGPDLTNPQTLNKYRYALNNPLRYVDPNGLYERDVHQQLTYALALAAGINTSAAARIAAADQGVDDNPQTSPYRDARTRAMYHFTDPTRRDFMYDEFAGTGSPENLGVYLHAEQDSFSHAGFGPNLGQGWPPWTGTGPDKTYNDPAKADTMARDTFNLLVSSASRIDKQLGANFKALDWKVVSPLVQSFNRARTPEEKQKALGQIQDLAQQNAQRQRQQEEKKRKRPEEE
jgi:RHS repeat-associated protein